jgi:hypothetical protein
VGAAAAAPRAVAVMAVMAHMAPMAAAKIIAASIVRRSIDIPPSA